MFTLSPLFTDHCIIPCGQELRVFGQADEGEIIHVLLTDQKGNVVGEGLCTGREGCFLAHLPAQKPGAGPMTLTLASENASCTVRDVRAGLLFLAGGQSNMELALWNADEGPVMMEQHDDPDLRYFNVPRVSVLDEEGLAAHAAARWQRIAPHQGGDMSAVAYFFARRLRVETGLPVGIIGCNWGGTSIACWMDEKALRSIAVGVRIIEDYTHAGAGITMEQWRKAEAAFQADMNAWNTRVAEIKAAHPGIAWSEVEAQAGKCPWNPPPGPGSPYRPCGLAETMLRQVAPAALTGVLFYQGESDTERAAVYGQLLIAMVLRWRELFRNPELPFFNVQLPMFIEDGAEDRGDWAMLRQSQHSACQALKNSYLAVMIDAGEWNNLHPTDKRTPGERLARLFMEHFTASSPRQPEALSKSASGGVMTVRANMPLMERDGEADLFEIAGEDGRFVPAEAELEGSCIRLRAEGIAHPVMARYAFVNYAKVHVFSAGSDALPLAPFLFTQ